MGRIWFGALTSLLTITITVNIVLSAQDKTGPFDTALARAINTLCYFTIWTNILVAAVSLVFVIKPKLDSRLIRVLQLDSFVCIIIVGVVYYKMIAPTDTLHGLEIQVNLILHAISPILFIIGWLIFMPHDNPNIKTVLLALIYPIVWTIFSLIRGAIIHYYPYSFMEVRDIGYSGALMNMNVLTVVFISLFFFAYLYEVILSKVKNAAS